MAKAEQGTTELVKATNVPAVMNDDALTSIGTLDDALRMLTESGVATESIADYGNGFTVCNDKNVLVGQAFVIVQWRFNDGDYGEAFVSANIVTEDGRKLVLNDGGTGIRAQLQQVTTKRLSDNAANPQAGLLCKRGLTKSEYNYESAPGKWTPAVTFYLAQ